MSKKRQINEKVMELIHDIAEIKGPKTITTHENQPIQDFAKQVFKTVVEDWGSINVDEFIEAFRKEVGEG